MQYALPTREPGVLEEEPIGAYLLIRTFKVGNTSALVALPSVPVAAQICQFYEFWCTLTKDKWVINVICWGL